jgi:hypothetical protein
MSNSPEAKRTKMTGGSKYSCIAVVHRKINNNNKNTSFGEKKQRIKKKYMSIAKVVTVRAWGCEPIS